MTPVVIGNATLYLGDCLWHLPMPAADAVVTDPPYGIEYSSGSTNRARGKAVYEAAFDDSREYVETVCVPAVRAALEACGGRGAVTPGVPCLWLYPEPSVLGGLYQPSAVGMNRWGFANFNPVCFYGKDPRAGKTISKTVLQITDGPSDRRHPCAKPQKAMDWLVGKVSLDGETVLDPFMGSGTTGVSCASMNRKFIGIELERKYFDIACERIENAQRQSRMFA
jgi:site-specific DNA-methyltransferase (adenine-specific)